MRPSFRLFVDFDGTISTEDSTDELLERFAEPDWEAAETDWLAGRIGSLDCLRRQVDALRLRPEALHAFVSSVEIDPGFRDFVETARSYGAPIAIVSDGLDLVIQGVLRAAGLSLPVFANKLVWRGGDRWSLAFPYSDPGCASGAGHCKCRSLEVDGASAVLVGDGRSDRCAAVAADFTFAKSILLDHCRANDLPHERFDGFRDLIPRFQRFAESRYALAPRVGGLVAAEPDARG